MLILLFPIANFSTLQSQVVGELAVCYFIFQTFLTKILFIADAITDRCLCIIYFYTNLIIQHFILASVVSKRPSRFSDYETNKESENQSREENVSGRD